MVPVSELCSLYFGRQYSDKLCFSNCYLDVLSAELLLISFNWTLFVRYTCLRVDQLTFGAFPSPYSRLTTDLNILHNNLFKLWFNATKTKTLNFNYISRQQYPATVCKYQALTWIMSKSLNT